MLQAPGKLFSRPVTSRTRKKVCRFGQSQPGAIRKDTLPDTAVLRATLISCDALLAGAAADRLELEVLARVPAPDSDLWLALRADGEADDALRHKRKPGRLHLLDREGRVRVPHRRRPSRRKARPLLLAERRL